jgi:preprotein translocase subunit YajC
MGQQYFFYVLLAVAFVALIVLPGRQRKKMAAKAQELQNSLTPGTRVMTTAGIHGTVSGLGDGTVDLEIAPGVPVTFERRAILQVVQPTVATDGTGATQAELPGPGEDTPDDGTTGTTR